LTEISDRRPTQAQIEAALTQFRGEITQRPPIFSAIKIDGKRAYKLARDGQEVEIPERNITIYSLELVDYSYPELKIRTHVSSGTYIRSLCVDIGKVLETGAYCTALRRTKIAEYDIANARQLTDFGIDS
jgi:tRNA pseudouridine55 synthase